MAPGTADDDLRRVTRPKARARAAYDRLSRWYDVFAAGERRFQRIGLELLDVQRGERVLELGVGTGWALAALAQSVGPEGGVVGVDIAPAMLRRAARRLERAATLGRAELCACDALHVPLGDATCDAAYLSFTLELFDTPEIPLVLAECRRVLRPGGRIAVVALAREDTRATRLYERLHDLFPATLDCRPIHPAAAVAAAGFAVAGTRGAREWGLGVEIVLGIEPEGPLGR